MIPLARLRLALLSVAFVTAGFLVGSAQDAKPVLMSRTGGNSWSNAKELEAAAKNNNPKAQAQLGELVLRGNADFPKDVPRAVALLEQAARAGQSTAAFRIGMLLENGEGVAPDQPRALAYFRAAAAGGSSEAFRNLAVTYSKGLGVKRDYSEALAWIILAKKHGTAGTVEDDLRSHIRSLGHPEWIAAGEKRAPELESELAQGSLIKLLPPAIPRDDMLAGAPLPRPLPEKPSSAPFQKPAVEKPAFDSGVTPVLPTPSLPVLPPMRSLAEDISAAIPVKAALPTGRSLSWPNLAVLQAAAESGNTDALAALGQIYLTGQQVSVDVTLAIVTLERGAKAGSADAAALLADLYTKGLQTSRDEKKAFTFTLQAARGGVPTAIYNLGALYANGTGTPSDYTESLTWLIIAHHFHLDPGQLARIRDYLAKSDAKQIPIAERRAAERVKEIDAARANLPGL